MPLNYNKIFGGKEDQSKDVEKANVEVVEPPEEVAPPVEPKIAVVISRGKLNVRSSPNTDCSVICLVTPGTELMVEETKDGWAHVYTSSGIEGYVMAEFIEEV